jgi:GNAT superfamily N-acetyltransferase
MEEILLRNPSSDEDFRVLSGLLEDFYKEIGHEIPGKVDLMASVRAFHEEETICIAECNAVIVGLICIGEFASVYAGGRFGILNELYVISAFRSKGIGHLLMQFAGDLCHKKGWVRLEVSTPEESEWKRIVEFYIREGFIRTGVKLKK